jgi:hypothetical protein
MDVVMSAVPLWALVALGALVVLQVGLDVFALVDLYRRPVEQVLGANKWVWLAVIVLVSTLGAVIYLVLARRPAVPGDPGAPPASRPVRTDDVADALYGPREDTDSR